MSGEPRRSAATYPGGIRVKLAWGAAGDAAAVFALSEAGGPLTDLGTLVGPDPDVLCRAEMRVETPAGAWTVRLASRIHDDPRGLAWDDPGLLVVAYGFVVYAFEARSGALRWSRRTGSPLVAVLGSPRLDHVIVQSEVETLAVAADGEVSWRVAQSDVVTAAELLGGRLVLTSYAGAVVALDPVTGRGT